MPVLDGSLLPCRSVVASLLLLPASRLAIVYLVAASLFELLLKHARSTCLLSSRYQGHILRNLPSAGSRRGLLSLSLPLRTLEGDVGICILGTP